MGAPRGGEPGGLQDLVGQFDLVDLLVDEELGSLEAEIQKSLYIEELKCSDHGSERPGLQCSFYQWFGQQWL